MEITTQMIKDLRAATSAPMLDCRKALQEANGDFQKLPSALTVSPRMALWKCIPTVVDVWV